MEEHPALEPPTILAEDMSPLLCISRPPNVQVVGQNLLYLVALFVYSPKDSVVHSFRNQYQEVGNILVPSSSIRHVNYH